MDVQYVGPVETFLVGRAFTPDLGPIKPGDTVTVHDLDGAQLLGEESGWWVKAEKKAATKKDKTEKVEEVQSQQ